jgi:putative transposase
MTPPADPERYKNHRFPNEIIRHGVWLYYRFPLSYHNVQELLFERGIDVTHEAIRHWCRKFGQDYASHPVTGALGLATSGTWTRSS